MAKTEMTRKTFPRRVGEVGADETGVTAVEFGLLAGPLMLFMIGSIEAGLIYGAQNTLDYAMISATRATKTGYVDSGSTQAKMVEAAIKKAASDYIDETKITVTSKSYTDLSSIKPEDFTDTNKNGKRDSSEAYVDRNSNGKYDDGNGVTGYGASGEIVVFTATYNWKMFTPMMGKLFGTNGVVTLSSKSVTKNEPYAPPATFIP